MISVYALQNEKVVSILDVIAGRAQVSSGFQCPRCAAELLPGMGQIRRPHFRHRILDAGRGETCTPEGVVHSAAKAIIAARVAEAVAAGSSYTLLLAAGAGSVLLHLVILVAVFALATWGVHLIRDALDLQVRTDNEQQVSRAINPQRTENNLFGCRA